MSASKLSEDIIKKIVNESQYPVVFKNMLQNEKCENVWKLLDWKLEELSEKIGDIKLPFRVGVNERTPHPQWEYSCEVKHMSMNEFLKETNLKNDSKWYYFDYKYMHEWFKDKLDILNSIDWRLFGFNISGADSTMWLGSKGAHTNCHQDSYGCNLVAQIHGRKQWILYPPDTEYLSQTRVPYEESTVYSRINFFSPTSKDVTNLTLLKTRPRVVTLNPGEILFVPHGWWHYVESLDTSLSVNTWLQMEHDYCDRLGEALVKLVVNRIGDQVSIAKDEPKYDLSQCLDFIKLSLQECEEKVNGKPFIIRNKSQKLDSMLENVFEKYKNNLGTINELSILELKQFLDEKRNRFPDNPNYSLNLKTITDTDSQHLVNAVVNAFCHPDVINKVIEILTFETFENKKT